MTSTDFSAGLASKNSCKVLKPPGGGSSDLFNGDIPSTPRSVKNYMRSNIFSAPENINKTGDKPRKVQPMDSYNRLFGENERPITPAKNRMRSNIPIGSDAADGKVNKGVTNGEAKNGHANGHSETNGKHTTNGNGLGNLTNISENGSSKNGNPVTGEGYITKLASTETNGSSNAGHVINKNRIPPGGFSSGLW